MRKILQTKRENIKNKTEFFSIISNIINNETVKKMKEYRQHCDTSCYEHCLYVAYYSYVIAKKLKLDYVSTARAAMLHDLFLYDWRKKYAKSKTHELHAFVHPKIALKNALMLFNLNEIEQEIILKHMWPVTISFPKYKETYVVTFMDKYSAIKETYMYIKSKLERNTFYRYAYIFFSLVVIKI